MEKKNPNYTFENVIKDENLNSISKDIGEVVLDGFLDEGVLKDIPILGSLVNSVKFVNTISQHIFLKKILLFLSHVEKVPVQKRKKVIDKINSSSKYRNRVGETIFEILEKVESEGKPEIIGKLFSGVLREEIDYQMYLKCVHKVKTIFYFDLLELKESVEGKQIIKKLSSSMIEMDDLIEIDPKFTENLERQISFDNDGNSKPVKEPLPMESWLTPLGDVIINLGMR